MIAKPVLTINDFVKFADQGGVRRNKFRFLLHVNILFVEKLSLSKFHVDKLYVENYCGYQFDYLFSLKPFILPLYYTKSFI